MHFVLVHSPSVGPSTWAAVKDALQDRGHVVDLPNLTAVVTLDPPSAPRIAELVATAVSVKPGEEVVLVTHSNAGFFGPAIGQALSGVHLRYVFVDASIPPSRGWTAVVPEELLTELRTKATDGFLPPWTEWWPEADVSPMFPDEHTRRTISREQPQLPLSYYEQLVEVPDDWDRDPCHYIVFGPPYDEIAEEASRREWPVVSVPGLHLHMVVDPETVASALETVAGAPSR